MEKKLILLVDDVRMNRILLSKILQEDYNLLEAENGKVALDLLKARGLDINVVILDIGMPVMGGYEVMKHMKEDPALAQIPVIIATSSPDSQTEAFALASGAWDLVKKPYDSIVLKHRVQNVLNITENIRLRQEIAKLHEHDVMQKRLSAIIDNMSGAVGMSEVSKVGMRNFYRNQQFYDLFEADSSVEHSDLFILSSSDEEQNRLVRDDIEQTIADGKPVERVLKLNTMKGKTIFIRSVISRIPYESTENPVVMGLFEDITKERERMEKEQQANDKIRYYAEMDPLTDVFNRRKFCQVVNHFLLANPSTDYVIVVSDIRGFKILNVMLGIKSCNNMLLQIRDRLKSILDERCVFGRSGDDRFVFCMPHDMLDLDVLEKNAVLDYLDVSSDTVVRMSFGIYEVTDRDVPVEIMCDRASHAAKSTGDDVFKAYAYYDEKVKEETLLQQRLSSDMERAIDEKQFLVYLQPVICVSPGKVVGAEALVRWFHPSYGILSPGIFIPLFEQNGFIVKLDKYMFEQACRILAQWKENGDEQTYISVNLSRRSIFGTDMVSYIKSVADRYGIRHDLLRIEITESVLAGNPEQIRTTLDQFHELGFTVMMDDFGSMYSSLNALKNLPVDLIKLDMKFIKDFDISDKSGCILTSVMMMTRWIGIGTIAEGVETVKQLDFLSSIGCNLFQGFYFSRPIPLKEFEVFRNEYSCHARVQIPSPPPISMPAKELLGANTLLSKVFEGMGIGAAFFDYTTDKIELIRANHKFFEFFNIPSDYSVRATRKVWKLSDYPNDDEIRQITDAVKNKCSVERFFEVSVPDQPASLIKRTVTFLGGSESNAMILITAMNTEGEMKSHLGRERIKNLASGCLSHLDEGIALIAGEDCPTMLYCNASFARKFGADPLSSLAAEDSDKISKLLSRAQNGESFEVDSIIHGMNQECYTYSWCNIHSICSTQIGFPMLFVKLLGGKKDENDVMPTMHEESQELMRTLETATPVGIVMFRFSEEDNRYMPVFFDNQLPMIIGVTNEVFMDILSSKDVFEQLVDKKYVNVFLRQFEDFIEKGKSMELVFRPKLYENRKKWVKVTSSSCYDESGRRILVMAFTSITREYNLLTETSDTCRMLFKAEEQAELFSWVYYPEDGSAEFSEYSSHMLGLAKHVNDLVRTFCEGKIAKADVETFKLIHKNISEGVSKICTQLHFCTSGNELIQIELRYTTVFENGIPVRAIGTAAPMHDQDRILSCLLQMATDPGDFAFVYNLKTSVTEKLMDSNGPLLKGKFDIIGNVHPDYCEKFREESRKAILHGERVCFSYKANYSKSGAGNWKLYQLKMLPLANRYGEIEKMVGMNRDISSDMEKINRFMKQKSELSAAATKGLNAYEVNITDNKVLNAYGRLRTPFASCRSYDGLIQSLKDCAADDKSRETLVSLDRKNLMTCYQNGINHKEASYQVFFNGLRIWIHSEVELSRNPDTEELTAFILSFDVSSEKFNQIIADSLVQQYYDFILLLSPGEDIFGTLFNSGKFHFDEKFDASMEHFSLRIAPEYRELFLKEMNMASIMARLENHDYFQEDYPMADEAGKMGIMRFFLFSIPGCPELAGFGALPVDMDVNVFKALKPAES